MEAKNKEVLKELLSINCNALQAAHYLTGYDFEKPYTIAKLEGPFTIRKALQAAGGADNCILLMIDADQEKSVNCWGHYELKFASVKYQKVNIDFSVSEPRKRSGERSTNKAYLDNFYAKRQFEEARKNNKVVYIIYQEKNNRSKTWEAYTNCRGAAMNSKKGRCINNTWERYRIKDFNYSNEKIDKSGYRVDIKRAELSRRARCLKAEKAAAGVASKDFTSDIALLSFKILETRRSIDAKYDVLNINSGDIYNYISILYKLNSTLCRFNYFVKNANDKSFYSLESAESIKKDILVKIKTITCELQAKGDK